MWKWIALLALPLCLCGGCTVFVNGDYAASLDSNVDGLAHDWAMKAAQKPETDDAWRAYAGNMAALAEVNYQEWTKFRCAPWHKVYVRGEAKTALEKACSLAHRAAVRFAQVPDALQRESYFAAVNFYAAENYRQWRAFDRAARRDKQYGMKLEGEQ